MVNALFFSLYLVKLDFRVKYLHKQNPVGFRGVGLGGERELRRFLGYLVGGGVLKVVEALTRVMVKLILDHLRIAP